MSSEEQNKARRRIALVTGAGQGIGLAVAEALLEEGCDLILVGRTAAKLDSAREKLCLTDRAAGVLALQADVTQPESVNMLAEAVERDFKRLDVLVNNVGNFVFAGVLQHSWEQWRDVIDSNLTSVYLICKAFEPLLRMSDAGRIINITAAYASIQEAFPGYGPYAAAKAAALSLTRTLASELAPAAVTVNAVSPGLIDTGAYDKETIERWSRLVPAGRFGRPEEVARAVAFLASAQASYITGTELRVDGGWRGEKP